MKRHELEHILRASAAICNMRDIVVIGSQSILGTYPDAPGEFRISMEADVFPKEAPQQSIVIDGAIGNLSLFHDTFGYYAHGVDDKTAIVPDGWMDRLVKVETTGTGNAIGWCLEVHDLAVSKLAAGREKDLEFVGAMVREKMISVDVVRERLEKTPRLIPELKQRAIAWLDRAR